MRSSQSCRLAAVLFTLTTNAVAAHLDMSDPRRALAREDDVRIDAELARDTISPGTPVVLTCQIENLSNATIALADRVTDSDYDTESQTVTISVGAEVPEAGKMPHLLLVHPGEKRTI